MGKRVDWKRVRELKAMIKGQGLKLSEGAIKFGIPAWQLYEVGRRDKDGDEEESSKVSQEVSAADQSEASDPEMARDRFKDSPLPEEIQRLILKYRKEDPGAGFKRIEDRLKGEHLVVVNRKQIRHVLL